MKEMTRQKKINRLQKNFSNEEIFCPHVLAKFRSTAWNYLSNEFIDTLYFIRYELFKKPIYINYPNDGRTQRGVRCNLCEITKKYTARNEAYLTAHALDGCDMDVEGLTAWEVRAEIKKNQSRLPHPIRLEEGVSWVHWDVRNYTSEKISWF